MTYLLKLNAISHSSVINLATIRAAKSSVVLSIMTITTILLTGCATTQRLTPQQCQSSNWQEVGYADGLQGRSGAYFGNYTNRCMSVGGAMPNRLQWEQGRQQGLKNYCTELNAYKLGREGYDWQPVCPLEGIEKLEEAYAQGRYYYIRQRDLNYLSSPYPFGYGPLGYGRFGYGYRPFGYGW